MMHQEMTIAKWLFNPFVRIAGVTSLALGLAVIVVGGAVAGIAEIRFNGLLDMQFAVSVPLWLPIVEGLLNWAVISALFMLAALLFGGGGVRLVDIAGTQALARAPLIPAAAICLAPPVHASFADWSSAPSSSDLTLLNASVLLGASAMVVMGIVWMVALMWNAFRVSCDLKGGRGVLVFVVVVLIGELISKFLLLRYL